MDNTFIYIPDISGFSNFVNDTEITHSNHIISELLELIIDSNKLRLEVSEVEGDAILFYKYESIPSLEEVIEQTKATFIKFHTHLKEFEAHRICQCGACRSAASLSLKFIAHAGDVQYIKIKKHKKLHGPAVILSHRLLKNSIGDGEYLLLSDDLLNTLNDSTNDLKEGADVYDGSITTSYKYMSLQRLHNEVPEPTPITYETRIKNPVKKELFINAPLYDVFETLTNLEMRELWATGIKRIEYDKGRINRLGTKHNCVLDNGEFEFETISNDFGKNALVYGERFNSPMAKGLMIYYVLEKEEKGTRVRIEGHYKKTMLTYLLLPLIRFGFKKAFKKGLGDLKLYCEKTFSNQPITV